MELTDIRLAVSAKWPTQREAAAACGIDESLLSQALTGNGKLGLQSAVKLIQAAGLPVQAARALVRPSALAVLDGLAELLAGEYVSCPSAVQAGSAPDQPETAAQDGGHE